MSKTYSPRRTATQWQSLIDQWHQSGQSAKQFCEDQAIGYASFCQWRKRLTQRDEPTGKESQSAPSFIDLSTLGAQPGQGWHIVLSLGDGVSLTLSQG
jgi:putative transposase